MDLRTSLVLTWTTAVLFAPAVQGQDVTLSRGTPEEVGMSRSVLDGAAGLYREAVARGDLVGAVVLVAKDGKIVWHEAIGSRDRARGLPMELNTMFRMASNTKPVVATAVSMLVEQGKLDYADLVREHIPSWDNYRAGFISVQHLLSHTSGLRIPTLFLEPLMKPSRQHAAAPSLQLEVARFGEVGAEVIPGTSFSYNNPGFNTLGALVEMGSGQPLEVFLAEHVYGPLGMEDSYHHEVDQKLEGKLNRMGAVYYERVDGEWVAGWTPGDPPQMPFVRASGGMISTAMDYAIFCQMFLNGGVYGGTRILTPETVALMTEPKTETVAFSVREGPGTIHYGYGWFTNDEGVYYHGGSDGTNAWVDPVHNLIGLVLTQTPAGPNPLERFQELVVQAIEPPAGG